jgi:uncharacterized membrane protein YfcA
MDSQLTILLILMLCGIFIGFAKTGVSTFGLITVVVLTMVLPAKTAVGLMLPALIVGDLVAVIYYRRTVVWKYLFSLLPWVLIGLLGGYMVLVFVENHELSLLMGVLILTLIVLQLLRERFGFLGMNEVPSSMVFTIMMGGLAGFATMIGNVAGVIMAIYLLSVRLPKQEFVGTGAWFFLFVNVIKVPFYMHLNMINLNSLTHNLWMVPAVLLGAYLGIKILPRIPQKWFQHIILSFGAAGAVRLIIMGL